MGLAPLVVGELYEAVAQVAQTGVSVLVVEQFATVGLRYASHAYVMAHGVVTYAGPSDGAMRRRPRAPTSGAARVTELFQFTLFGLMLGCVYAIASMGLVLTYTVTGVFNFAHGAVGMVAAFVLLRAAGATTTCRRRSRSRSSCSSSRRSRASAPSGCCAASRAPTTPRRSS